MSSDSESESESESDHIQQPHHYLDTVCSLGSDVDGLGMGFRFRGQGYLGASGPRRAI